ncbi:uncharacterized protein LOC8274965 [Ricinus communis]|uniref:Uncharacterized protein n=1 Tax=Ricinus communis TaxID=3988 RepID=B9RFR4_RICCO|nr:uncharacterized protein LOC8274965 [Ricinus communis]EEF50035.1 conserved hypothetical protein [Ricinus communis]|eukprot:XP_015570451.1 uncharacterized protein LOC8274965 [Ricinus communis]
MGGNSRQNGKKSVFSAFNFFKRKPRRVEDYSYDDVSSARRVFPSDEDGRGFWRVADPCIDTKTSAFIAHFHSTRFSEPDRQIYQPAAKA